MIKKYSATLLVGLFFALVTISYVYYSYSEMVSEEMVVAKAESETLNEFLLGYRDYYQKLFAEKKMPLTAETLHALPAFALYELSTKFSQRNNLKITLQTVSDVARNPSNEANEYQKEIINIFKTNSKLESDFRLIEKDGEKFYHYSSALRVSEMCLKCHGKKDDAPDFIQARYPSAYDYKTGDVRGITSIKIPFEQMRNRYLPSFYVDIVYGVAVMLLLFAISGYFLVALRRQNETLEEKVKEQTKELKEINERLERLVSEEVEKVRQRDATIHEHSRQSAINELLIDIAHQWRQPLNVITVCAANIKDNLEEDGIKHQTVEEFLDKISKHAVGLSGLISRFTGFYNQTSVKKLFTIEYAVNDLIIFSKEQLSEIGMIIKTNDCSVEIYGEEKLFVEILRALLQNSMDAAKAKGVREPYILFSCAVDEDELIIKVQDNCGGIDNDMLPKIFQPYTTTNFKSANRGLGLYVVHNFVRHFFDGEISAKNLNGGAIFVLRLKNIKEGDVND